MEKENRKIIITKDGPYLLPDDLPLEKEIITPDESGEPARWVKGENYPNHGKCALCRCGHSGHHPFCDGTHLKIKFNGTETASREKYAKMAMELKGPDLDLADVPSLCASARFCHRAGGTWELTENSDDPKSKEIAIQEACDCPSGRLVALDKKTQKPIEPKFKQSISLVEDPQSGVSGPIFVKGGVSVVSADGHEYEIRNSVTLCRCGKSKNKPFCDGSHIPAGFSDKDK